MVPDVRMAILLSWVEDGPVFLRVGPTGSEGMGFFHPPGIRLGPAS